MNITIVFFLGVIVALIGVVTPGLLNMTAAKISLKEGANRGIVFSIGASVIVLVQTFIALIFARYLSQHPDVVDMLQWVALVLFVLISFYFFFVAKDEGEFKNDQVEVRSKKSRFFQGVLMSALNVFPIPYHAYMSITLASFGWLTFNNSNIWAYVLGSTAGSFTMFYVYIFFFDKIQSKRFKSQKNMNRLIGLITAIVALITLVQVIKKSI